jgi:hypothetical protein
VLCRCLNYPILHGGVNWGTFLTLLRGRRRSIHLLNYPTVTYAITVDPRMNTKRAVDQAGNIRTNDTVLYSRGYYAHPFDILVSDAPRQYRLRRGTLSKGLSLFEPPAVRHKLACFGIRGRLSVGPLFRCTSFPGEFIRFGFSRAHTQSDARNFQCRRLSNTGNVALTSSIES